VAENLGLVDFFKLTYKEIDEDHVTAFAGNLTYKGVFAIFPFFTFLLSFLGLFNASDLVNVMVDKLSDVAPRSAREFVEGQLPSITQSQAESAFTFGAIISILLALWGVSGAFRSVMEAMNVMYEIEEDRPLWKVYGLSIFMWLAVVVLLVGGLVIFGESIGVRVADLVGLGSVFATIWSIVQWPVVALVVLFALIYYVAPAAKQRFRWISPGSILAFWLIFSLLFSLYTSIAGSYNETYESLAGVIVLMFYDYYSALIMLIGAEITQVIEWHIPGGKNEGEKIPEADRRSDVHRLNSEAQ
jgi:membrane protein